MFSINKFIKSHMLFNSLDRLNNFFIRWDRYYPEPIFWDIDKTCPELRELENNFSFIQKECAFILENRDLIPTYDKVDPYITTAYRTPGKWQVFMLKGWNYEFKENQKWCPQTTLLLNKIPNIFQAFFSILDPYKYIHTHRGNYKGYLRYHLGVQIPSNPTPHLLVNDKMIYWKEGEGFIFDDFHWHEAFNDNQKPRTVLIVDIVRKRPFTPRVVNYLFLKYIVRPFYFNKLCNSNASVNFDKRKK
jgi:aspartyl/asparaginyl beta-hydroxylase (cupin superfamily)